MKIESKDFACVTNVEIVPINIISNEVALASNVEIKANIEENDDKKEIAAAATEQITAKVPYILNGELYQILARNGENVTVKCCFCPAGRFYRGSVRSTGNFHMHIKRRHPYLLGRLHDMKVASLLERRDRLTKNRKTKLRRLTTHRKTSKGEIIQDLHKLKIKRAFQRHQAEAKESLQILSPQKYETLSTEIVNNAQNIEQFSTKEEQQTIQSHDPLSKNEIILTSNNSNIMIDGNVYCNVHVRNSKTTHNSSPQDTAASLTKSQQTTPTPTPYPSTYDGSAFGEYSSPPPAIHHVEIQSIDEGRPIDLSFNSTYSNEENSAAADLHSSTYESSGIGGLGPMPSDTTVANTISTTISAIKSPNDHHLSSSAATMFHNCDGTNWQRLAITLRDIQNDIRTRNRIEHNRLLLDIAKFKFLNPGFYFNFQE